MLSITAIVIGSLLSPLILGAPIVPTLKVAISPVAERYTDSTLAILMPREDEPIYKPRDAADAPIEAREPDITAAIYKARDVTEIEQRTPDSSTPIYEAKDVVDTEIKQRTPDVASALYKARDVAITPIKERDPDDTTAIYNPWDKEARHIPEALVASESHLPIRKPRDGVPS